MSAAAPLTIDDLAAKLDAILTATKRANARFLSVEEAADYCSLSVESIRRMIETGKLQPLRPIAGRVLIDRLQLDALVTSSTKPIRKGRGIR